MFARGVGISSMPHELRAVAVQVSVVRAEAENEQYGYPQGVKDTIPRLETDWGT